MTSASLTLVVLRFMGSQTTDLETWRSRRCCVRSLVAFCVPMGVLGVAEAQSAGGSPCLGFKGTGGQRMSNIGRGTGQDKGNWTFWSLQQKNRNVNGKQK